MKVLRCLFIVALIGMVSFAVWAVYYGNLLDQVTTMYEKDFQQMMQAEVKKQEKESSKSATPLPPPATKQKSKPNKRTAYSFRNLDIYVRNTPDSTEHFVVDLAEYLNKKAKTDIEKARAIYIWLTDNIAYDASGFNSGNYSPTDADNVLRNKTAVCEGFSNLFVALGREMDLNVEKVSGYAKGYSYKHGDILGDKNLHAWNIVYIDGHPRVFDATWGRGFGTNVNGKLVSKKSFDNYWFDVDPYEAIFTHYPTNLDYAFVEPKITANTFRLLPKVSKNYFAMGFAGKETYDHSLENINTVFPDCFDLPFSVNAITAPKYKVLTEGENYDFIFSIPNAEKLALVDAKGNWTQFKKVKSKFSTSFTPNTSGELKLCVTNKKGSMTYQTIMLYEVHENPENT